MKKLIPYIILAAVIGVMLWADATSASSAIKPPGGPLITVTNPAHQVAEIQWSGLPASSQSVLLTCDGVHECGEILIPSTGDYRQYPISGTHRWKVCVPGPTQDICTPWSPWETIR